jgi:cytochrome b561
MEARYDRTARLLHWFVATLLIGQFAFGWWLGDVPRNTPARGYFVNLHKSSGMLIGLLIVLRVVWRFLHSAPPLPATVARWQQRLAAASHFGLYVCMVLMPLSGYLASNFSKHGVKFFNAVLLPPWGSDDKLLYSVFNQTHKVTAVVLLGLVVLHVLAASKHGLQRDGIISRIWLRPF